MRHIFRHISFITVFLCVAACSFAQVTVRASADSNSILIGDPLNITVEAYVPLGSTVQWFSTDTIPHFEITAISPLDTVESMDGKKMVQTITVTSFDSGRHIIPSFEIQVGGRSYISDSIDVQVAYISYDPKEDYKDIKEIIEAEDSYSSYIPWVIGALALLSLALLIWLYRKKKPLKTAVKETEPALSPFEEAMRALDKLSRYTAAEIGEKEYYSTMNDILRRYISRKFRIPTFEKTNEELVMQLSRFHIPREAFLQLTQSLRMADFVKFAKYRPGEEDNRNNLGTVRTSIEILDNQLTGVI